MDSFTQPAGGTPNPVAWPPLDDGGAHSGKPPKAIKTQIRQMQLLSRLILYQAVHYKEWSGSLPHDLINMAVDGVLKRLTEARVRNRSSKNYRLCVMECLLTDPGWS